jgi:hypothetical protein
LLENQPAGTMVETLSTSDADAGDSFTYSLVSGAGADDNAKFQVSGGQLQTSQALDFEARSSLSVRLRRTTATAAASRRPSRSASAT